MLLRAAFGTMTVLITLVGPGGESTAQPNRGYYAQAYPHEPNQPVPHTEGDDVLGPSVVRPGSEAGSTRRDLGAGLLPPEVRPEIGPAKELPTQFRRAMVDYYTKEPAGTIIVDTPNTYLYFVLGNGKALRYGIGVGREGFTWSGSEKVSRMAEWPDWNPPEQMIERQPYLPRFMAGGEGNPLGARALYLGDTLFRIHGTNQPSTIGTFVSSGCIRLTNDDVTDLYRRVKVGTRVVVMSAKPDGPAVTAVQPGSRRLPSTTISGAKADTDLARKRKGAEPTAKPQPADVPGSAGQSSADARHTGAPPSCPPSETESPKRDPEMARGNSQHADSIGPARNNVYPMNGRHDASAFEE